MRTKKHAVESRASGMLPLSTARPFTLDPLVDNVSRYLAGSGFSQVVLPPVDELRHFPEWVAEPFLVRGGHGSSAQGEWGLWPTHVLNIKKQYRKYKDVLIPSAAKWFYVLPVVRQEGETISVKHELGVFVLGQHSSLAYAQLVSSVVEMFRGLGLPDAAVEIGSRGCPSCQRAYAEALRDEVAGGSSGELCERCAKNLPGSLSAVWNCSNESCQTVISGVSQQMIDFLDESCRALLMDTLETIDGLEIPYILNSHLPGHVSAERIVFDLVVAGAAEAGASSRVVAGRGGSYFGLPGSVPAEDFPAIGFLTDLETVASVLPEGRPSPRPVEVFVISLGTAAGVRALQLFHLLRRAGISAADGFLGNSGIRTQLKAATDMHSEIALIIGQKEALDETVILRDIRSGMQEVFVMDRIIEEVQKRLAP